MRILNTRPTHQAGKLSQAIHRAGGVAIELPTLKIEALSLNWICNLPELSMIQKAVFVSTNAVDYFFRGLRSQNILWPKTIQTFAIGRGTANRLKQYGILDCQYPTIADSEHFLTLPDFQKVAHQSVLLVSGENGRPLLASNLLSKGAHLYQIHTYRRCLPEKNDSFTHTLWQDDAVDIILILSQQAMSQLFELFEKEAKAWIQSKTFVVISQRLVDFAYLNGIRKVMLSTYDDLLGTLTRLKHGTR